MNELKQRLLKYGKDGKLKQHGYFYAIKHNDGIVKVGFSLCCKNDKFDKIVAIDLAMSRALSPISYEVPSSIELDVDKFISRCQRYFKTNDIEL